MSVVKRKVIRICYFGDSITHGLGHDHQGVEITKRWSATVDDALKGHEQRGVFIYSLNLGENGNTTRNGLERLPDLYAFRPDLVTVQFGMNDCNYWLSDGGLPRVNPVSFKHNLKEMVEKLFAAGVSRVLLSTNHLIPVEKRMLNGKDYNENNRYYNSLIREVAQEAGVSLCDIESLLSDSKWNKALILDEIGKWIHLSELGNRVYGERILPHIERELLEILG